MLGKLVAQATGTPTDFPSHLITQIAYCVGRNESVEMKGRADKVKISKRLKPFVTMLIICDPMVAMQSCAWNPTEMGFDSSPQRWVVSVNCPNASKSIIPNLINGSVTADQLRCIAHTADSWTCVATPMHSPVERARAARGRALAGEAHLQLCTFLSKLLHNGSVSDEEGCTRCFSNFAARACRIYRQTVKCRDKTTVSHHTAPRCTTTNVFVLDVLTCFADLLPTLQLLSADGQLQWSALMHTCYMEICGDRPIASDTLATRVKTIRQLTAAILCSDKERVYAFLKDLPWVQPDQSHGDMYVFEPFLRGLQHRAHGPIGDWEALETCKLEAGRIYFKLKGIKDTLQCDEEFFHAFFVAHPEQIRRTKLRRMICRVLYPPPAEFEDSSKQLCTYQPRLY